MHSSKFSHLIKFILYGIYDYTALHLIILLYNTD